MKYYIILLFIFALTLRISAQDGLTEAEALDPNALIDNGYFGGNYDNPLFVNNDLSLNSSPQNEPSVRISRTNPNFVVAAWRGFQAWLY